MSTDIVDHLDTFPATRPQRLILIRPGALGDTLLALPALALLRRWQPAARITFVARRDVLPLVHASRLAEVALPYDDAAWASLFAPAPPTAGLARATLADADLAVAWLPDPEGTVARNLAALGAGRVLVAPGRPPADTIEHAALFLMRALAPLAPLGLALPAALAALAALLPPIVPPREDAAAADALWAAPPLSTAPARVVALHPGSGAAAKRWPPAHFADLAARIASAGLQPLLLAGPQDADPIRDVLAALPPSLASIPIARDLSIGALAALLARCAAFVGNDSGVAHLAGLLGLPTLALFGPTDPALWSPLGPRVHTLQAPAGQLPRLIPDAAWHALRSLLALPA